MAAPKTKTHEAFALINKLIAIKADEAGGLDFGIMRLYKIIKEVERAHPVEAYCLWGGYYALLEDKEATQKYYEMALNKSPSAVIYFNYAVALSFLDEKEKALEIIQKALSLDPANLEYITDALGMSKAAGKEDIYKHWIEKYGQLVKVEEDTSLAEGFSLACQSDSFRDWESSVEENAWKHLQ